jgi:hypothetical protein
MRCGRQGVREGQIQCAALVVCGDLWGVEKPEALPDSPAQEAGAVCRVCLGCVIPGRVPEVEVPGYNRPGEDILLEE